MLCMRCGSQVEPLDNFCRNCGVRLSQSTGATAAESSRTERERAVTSAAGPSGANRLSSRAAREVAFSPTRNRKGIDAMTMILAGIVLLVIVGAGVYFGTDFFEEPGKLDRPFVAGGRGASSPEEMNRASGPIDNGPTSVARSQPPQPPHSAPVELSNPPSDQPSKSFPDINTSEPPARKAPLQSHEQQSPGTARSGKVPASAPVSRRASAAGTYETRDSTPLFESPSPSSRVVANIPGGTRVDVVGSNGDWLEVHSRRGNPPGFIRRQDATLLGKTD